MTRPIILLLGTIYFAAFWNLGLLNTASGGVEQQQNPPIGQPGQVARYRLRMETNLPGSVVETFTIQLGSVENRLDELFQWLSLEATKANGKRFQVWLLSSGFPPPTLEAAKQTTARYILQE